jgi:hypothetical protein
MAFSCDVPYLGVSLHGLTPPQTLSLYSSHNRLREPVPADQREKSDPYVRLGGYLPATSEPLTRWRSPANRTNDYMIDYERQRTKMFSGIPRDGKLQDMAVMESMGTIYDRPMEHLGRLDTMIVAVRRTLMAAAKSLRDEGTVHATVTNPQLYRLRSVEIMLPEGVDWFQATEAHRSSDSGVRLKNCDGRTDLGKLQIKGPGMTPGSLLFAWNCLVYRSRLECPTSAAVL